jgi:hypothetical protein
MTVKTTVKKNSYIVSVLVGNLFLLLEEMGTKKAFKYSKFKEQCPIAFQLLVFLFRIGKEGTGGGALSVSTHFGIGKGSIKNHVSRYVLALH